MTRAGLLGLPDTQTWLSLEQEGDLGLRWCQGSGELLLAAAGRMRQERVGGTSGGHFYALFGDFSVDYNLPGSCVHGILQARVLEWVAISFSNA